MSHRRALAASAATCLLLLGACAPGAPTDAPQSAAASPSGSSPTASPTASATPEATPSMEEPGLDATKPINADNWMSSVEGLPPVRSDDPAKALALTGMRAATHEGFTRVVLEFSGEGTPGVWRAAWTDEAVEQGRGLPIQVDGEAVLDLVIDGTPMTATNTPYPSGTHTRAGDLDVVSDGTFEDNTHVVIGAPTSRQFQIGFLSNPVRMVIDIRD
ncbi:hypothetical protein NE578_06840 [Schaalia odontolytica]|uniref:AMIN-like domain-containing (lipo)protein n=1 Tax=Actinomycetaceae TaxID=2049 RepID=UPI00045287E2|nr:hypothetical protein [Actinomyces sp. ICM54]EWC95330.1 hypothetical protein HMPREF1522_1790 [Actinomyces sp. ICM54]MCQ5272743.1 hypothetical protein [Schaalia odontolytica]